MPAEAQAGTYVDDGAKVHVSAHPLLLRVRQERGSVVKQQGLQQSEVVLRKQDALAPRETLSRARKEKCQLTSSRRRKQEVGSNAP